MRTILFFGILLLFATCSIAQSLKPSNTYIDTYYHGEKHFSMKEAAFVYYNAGNSELIIEIDFSRLKSGVDSLDEWLSDLADSKLMCTVNLPSGEPLALTQHNTKSMVLNGKTDFNGKTHNQVVYITFYEISTEGLLYKNTSDDYLDRILVNLQFSFLPKHFGINKKPHHLRKKISIAIGRGILNKK